MDFIARIDRNRVAVGGGGETHFVTLAFDAPPLASEAARPRVDLALVLDRSGSMAGEKIALGREAVDASLRLLHDDDRLALVVFDNEIDLLTPAQHATAPVRASARAALRAVDARGSTNLCGGWLRGAKEIEAPAADGRLRRVLLSTDGLANQGVVDHAEILRHAEALHARGVSTSTFGIGDDFDEELLQAMADKGGGHSYYIETPRQIVDLLASELGESLTATLRKATVEVSVPSGVSVSLLHAFPVTPRTNGLAVELGDLTAEQRVELMFAVHLMDAPLGTSRAVGFALRHGEGGEIAATAEARWTFATAAEAAAAARDREVEARVAAQMAAQAREKAVALNRAGKFDDAVRATREAAEMLRPLGVDNAAAQAAISDLEGELPMFASRMPSATMKRLSYGAYSLRRGRDPEGRARKKGD